MNISIKLKNGVGRLLLIAVMTMLLPAGAFAKDVFEDLTQLEDVESTYISGRFAHNKKRWASRDGEHSMNFGQGFSSMYIYGINSRKGVERAERLLNKALRQEPGLELVMSTRQRGTVYEVYEQFDDAGNLHHLIIWSLTGDESAEVVSVYWKEGLSPKKRIGDQGYIIINGETEDGVYGLDELRRLEGLKNLENLKGLRNLIVQRKN